jgi:NADH dehydrogenase [ubiquinone] 1 alpha subcomplex assembly factor 7
VADLARTAAAGCGNVMRARRIPRAAAASTPLGARLQERIAHQGPLSVADFMQACLADTHAGYYASRQPIGGKGDFITAPEISQIFGELLGLWCLAVWQSLGEPPSVIVVELGPGRGTLASDALRAWHTVPSFLASASIALVETSPTLREAQCAALDGVAVPVRWYETIETVPEGPLILLANEFIDALPVRQLVRRGRAWRERCVTVDADGAFAFAEGDLVDDADLPSAELKRRPPEGAILETRPAAARLVSVLAMRAANAPLSALLIDYGHAETGFGDTLQAVRAHRFADPLGAPGEADLSAHVAFADLKRTAKALGLAAYGPVPQGEFLLKLGLGPRRDRLLEHASLAQKAAIASGSARLVDPNQMGVLFKVLALTSGGLPPPPPFSPDI